MNVLALSRDEFNATVRELEVQGMDTAGLKRQYREASSPFSPLYEAANRNRAELAEEGRRPVLGGLLSKEPVAGVDTIRYEGIGPMMAGLLEPVARAVDAPYSAAQGLIPAEDMIGEAMGTAGVATGAGGAVARPAGSVGMGGFEDYLSRVNPNARRVADEDRPNLMMGDMYGMLPRGSEVVGERGDTTFFRSSDGDYYATAYNPDVGEQDVVGYIMGRGDGTELQVVDEMKGQGIGGELQYLFRRENPDAPTGGLTEAGERSLERTYDRLFDEGIVSANASKSAGLLGVASDGFLDRLIRADDIPASSEAQQMAKRILQMREQGRSSEVTKEMMEAADPETMALYTPLDMSDNARMARARELGFEDQTYYHGAKDTPELPYFDSIDEYNTEGHIGTIYGTSSPAVANTYLRKSSDDENAIYPLMVRRDPNDPTINVDGVYSRIPMSIKDEKGRSLISVLPDAAEMDHLNAERVTNTDAIAEAMRDADFSMLRMENVIDRGPYYPDATPFGFQAKSYKDIERQNQFNKWNRGMLAEANQPATNIMVQDAAKLRSRFARFDPEFSHLSNLTAANASTPAGLLAMQADDEQDIRAYLRSRGLLNGL